MEKLGKLGVRSFLEKKELHFYLHKFSLDEEEFIADFNFNLLETLVMSGNERILIKQCILPALKVSLGPILIQFNNKYKIKVDKILISSGFDICDEVSKIFQQAKDKFGINPPVLSFDKKIKTGLKLIIPPEQSLTVSENIANILFQGKESFVNNNKNEPLMRWFKIQGNFNDSTYFLLCDLLQNTTVGNLQIPLINTLVVQNTVDSAFSHLIWNNEESQGKTFLRAGNQRKIKLSIIDKEGNFAQLRGGLFFIHLKICI